MTSDEAVVFVNRTLGNAYVGERLAGGFFDHVLRVRRRDSPSSVIVKRVESFAQALHERELPLRRLARETRVLHLFDRKGPLHSLHGRVRTPRVHWAELRTRTVVFEDVGRCPSLETMSELPLEPVGRFVGSLHVASPQRKVGWLRRLFAKPQLGVLVGVLEAGTLSFTKPERRRFEQRAAPLRSEPRCLLMGSLYPSSILSAPSHVFLVGWGDARPGQPAEDVGCLGAHLWMAWRAASTPAQAETIRGSWTAFLKGYREATAGLWDGPQRELAALCFGLEVMDCTGGSTQERGALRDLEQHDPKRAHAVQAATASLLGDAPDAWFEGLP